MSLITLDEARAHLHVGAAYPAAQFEPYLNAAESMAAEFINRRVFATQAELTAAIAAVPADLAAAGVAYTASIAAADALTDAVAARAARLYACQAYDTVQASAREVYAGMALDATGDGLRRAYLFKAGVLLILGHLFENREEVVIGTITAQIPMGMHNVLMPLRTGLGV